MDNVQCESPIIGSPDNIITNENYEPINENTNPEVIKNIKLEIVENENYLPRFDEPNIMRSCENIKIEGDEINRRF